MEGIQRKRGLVPALKRDRTRPARGGLGKLVSGSNRVWTLHFTWKMGE